MEKRNKVDVVREPLTGVELIQRERERQQWEEGWDSAHDEQHINHELPIVAACYAVAGLENVEVLRTMPSQNVVDAWPKRWAKRWDKRDTHPRLRALAIAGALIAAEIDRLQALGVQNEADYEDNAREKWIGTRPEVAAAFSALVHALGNGKGVNAAARVAAEKLRPLVLGGTA